MAFSDGIGPRLLSYTLAAAIAPVTLLVFIFFFAGAQDYDQEACSYMGNRGSNGEVYYTVGLFAGSLFLAQFAMATNGEDMPRTKMFLKVASFVAFVVSFLMNAVIILSASCDFTNARGTSTSVELAGYTAFSCVVVTACVHLLDNLYKVGEIDEEGRSTGILLQNPVLFFFQEFGAASTISVIYVILSAFILNFTENGHGIDYSTTRAGCNTSLAGLDTDASEYKFWENNFQLVDTNSVEDRAKSWAITFVVFSVLFFITRIVTSYFQETSPYVRLLSTIAHFGSDISLGWWFSSFVRLCTVLNAEKYVYKPLTFCYLTVPQIFENEVIDCRVFDHTEPGMQAITILLPLAFLVRKSQNLRLLWFYVHLTIWFSFRRVLHLGRTLRWNESRDGVALHRLSTKACSACTKSKSLRVPYVHHTLCCIQKTCECDNLRQPRYSCKYTESTTMRLNTSRLTLHRSLL